MISLHPDSTGLMDPTQGALSGTLSLPGELSASRAAPHTRGYLHGSFLLTADLPGRLELPPVGPGEVSTTGKEKAQSWPLLPDSHGSMAVASDKSLLRLLAQKERICFVLGLEAPRGHFQGSGILHSAMSQGYCSFWSLLFAIIALPSS